MAAEADEVLERLAALPTGVVELAALCSLAVRVEPELLRSVRLHAAPHLSGAEESGVWSSTITAGWSPTSVTFSVAALHELRGRLRQRLGTDPQAVHRAHDVLSELHRGQPPALRLEEEIAWLHVSRGEDGVPQMETVLGGALRSLVEQDRRGLARWWSGAWERLPERARRTSTAARLCLVTSALLGDDAVAAPLDAMVLDGDLEAALRGVPDTVLGVLREDGDLLLGEVDRTRGAALLVPDTVPRLLEVEWYGRPVDRLALCYPEEVPEEQADEVARAFEAVGSVDVDLVPVTGDASTVRRARHVVLLAPPALEPTGPDSPSGDALRDLLRRAGRGDPAGRADDRVGVLVLPGTAPARRRSRRGAVPARRGWPPGETVRLPAQRQGWPGPLRRLLQAGPDPGPQADEWRRERVAVAPGAVVRRRLGTGPVRLHTARGTTYDVPRDVARQVPTLRTPGIPALGAHWDGSGTHFGLYSGVADRVELCLFDDDGHEARLDLDHKHGGLWHAYVPGVGAGRPYGYRVHGPYDPSAGLRCDPRKLLLDPYARAVAGGVDWAEPVFSYRAGGSGSDEDSAPHVPRSLVVDPAFDWGPDRPPGTPLHDTVVYEAHVRGLTMLHPEVPPPLRGTYAGLAHPAVLDHLTRLGVTAVELMPVHQFVHEAHLLARGLREYWGYNSLAFFAPHNGYSASGEHGGQVAEFKSMVKALHAAGLEVILDVVYNHTAEGNHIGPTLCYRGIDNAAYYRLVDDSPEYYYDTTGSGNVLNVRHPRALHLILDSLRYWVTEMHVDGFRFDLAAALARQFQEVDRLAAFFTLVQQDPVVSRVKLVAEPWDVGEGGYQVGNFPPTWTEWNGRYRDTVRDYWRGEAGSLGEFATRLAASSDLYASDGRRPGASINFVTAHDGFTLNDLVSYNEKHNEANGEANTDGESHSRSWNCGVEGPTDDLEVNALRGRQQRNLLTTLLLSQGVPMLLHGDELSRTQGGNNNVYCQDNEISWVDWTRGPREEALLGFTRSLVRLRQQNPVFRRRRWLEGRPLHGASELDDVVWFAPSGDFVGEEDWADPAEVCIGMFLNGDALPDLDESGSRVRGDSFLLWFNASPSDVEFTAPPPAFGAVWDVAVDTAEPDLPPPGVSAPVRAGKDRLVPSRSVVVLRRRP